MVPLVVAADSVEVNIKARSREVLLNFTSEWAIWKFSWGTTWTFPIFLLLKIFLLDHFSILHHIYEHTNINFLPVLAVRLTFKENVPRSLHLYPHPHFVRLRNWWNVDDPSIQNGRILVPFSPDEMIAADKHHIRRWFYIFLTKWYKNSNIFDGNLQKIWFVS